jgi:hypothetical protein
MGVGLDAGDAKRREPHAPGGLGTSLPTEGLLEQILDRFVRATFAIAVDGKLLYQNAAARALTARKELLKLSDGRLHFVDRVLHKGVTQHLAERHDNQQALMLRSTIAQKTPPSRMTYRVLLTPLHAGAQHKKRLIWLLFVSEFNRERKIESEVLRQLYALTQTESLLVACLFAGNSLTEAASILGISINTRGIGVCSRIVALPIADRRVLVARFFNCECLVPDGPHVF